MQTITTIGLNIAKSVFQVHGASQGWWAVPCAGSRYPGARRSLVPA